MHNMPYIFELRVQKQVLGVSVIASILTYPTAEEVDGGSLTITVKYKNYVPVMNQKKNLCDIPDILDEPCPLQQGVHDATISRTFPDYAPSVSKDFTSFR